jgi:hypothetical protein
MIRYLTTIAVTAGLTFAVFIGLIIISTYTVALQ